VTRTYNSAVEVSLVRRRLKSAIDHARQQAQQRRLRAAEAERTYADFLDNIAIPVARMAQNALKAEGINFTLNTPSGTVRLAADKGRNDYVEILLDTTQGMPQVIGRVSQTRGSRTIENERPLKPGAAPDALTEDDVLEFLVQALDPWL
jgi:hypothetical protein